MTSETQTVKTNEFLRRRKLRIQQVREQSKEIAKKIRLRARVEKLRHVADLDEKKQKEYFHHQEKLINKLEQYYAKGLQNIGAGHKNASEVNLQDDALQKVDLSKQRGREAAAELRRNQQEKLDKQKKLLDRKLQARETANEISRDKSSTIANKLLTKPLSKSIEEKDKNTDNPTENPAKETNNPHDEKSKPDAVTSNMATQWEFEELPKEWEPHVPKLSLPKDDRDSSNKRLNLFAISDEMPSSLRGGLTSVPQEESVRVRPSLTLVSEYLQNRKLRLRDNDTTTPSKNCDDMQSIKRTILRTRSSHEAKPTNIEKPIQSSEPECALTKKSSMTVYNHSTRDTRDIPRSHKPLVIREPMQSDDDAYSQAVKESLETSKNEDHQKRLQDMRSKVAMTKQHVEKEYKDTMAFLTSIHNKDKSKPIKNAYMGEQRQQMRKENHQRKLQHEFKNIERECRRHPPMNSEAHKSKSPSRFDSNDDLNGQDFQYSWMPVPESDGSLAIHTIPTTVKPGKSGNTVKFSQVDSYHEYRSRHKHTPPTKDTASQEKQSGKRVVEAVVIDQNDNESTGCSSIDSDTSSVENSKQNESAKAADGKLTDAERIIIYKILDSKTEKRHKQRKHYRLLKELAKSLSSIDKEKIFNTLGVSDDQVEKRDEQKTSSVKLSKNVETSVSFEHLNEGVYKGVHEQGDNISSLHLADSPRDRPTRHGDAGALRPCVCGNKVDDRLLSAGVQWESGDEPPRTRPHSATPEQRKCSCGHRPTGAKLNQSSKAVTQPSEATSSTSFKSADTNKTNLPESNFIKLLNEGQGQEAGKFYVGATGFLQDNAYEVVIQLRKKEESKTEIEVAEEKLSQEIIDVTKSHRDVGPKLSTAYVIGAKKKGLENEVGSNVLPPQKASVSQESVNVKATSHDKQQTVSNSESSDETLNVSRPLNNLADKGVLTNPQLSYAVYSNTTKSVDSISRPATSAYTQTTLRSPDPRPAFQHMSSSTSTAYMSPPEMILPYFLKNDYKVPYDEMYIRNSNLQDGRFEFTDEKEYCEEFAGCMCRRCTHTRRLIINQKRSPLPSKMTRSAKKEQGEMRAKTPPNTARSNSECVNDVPNTGQGIKEELVSARPASIKAKCHKCEGRRGCKTCFKNHKRRSIAPNIRPSRNLVMRINTKRNVPRTDTKVNKFAINPVVKSYVDKLLALNTEGVKAVEVMNQECSSVTTPGSSIIEYPKNFKINENRVEEKKLSLEQIKDMLTQQIFKKNENDQKHDGDSDTNRYENRYGRKLHRIPKTKSIHKVKSLNISKRLFKRRTNRTEPSAPVNSEAVSSSSSTKMESTNNKKSAPFIPTKPKSRSKSSPPRKFNYTSKNKIFAADRVDAKDPAKVDPNVDNNTDVRSDSELLSSFLNYKQKQNVDQCRKLNLQTRRNATTSESDPVNYSTYPQERHVPLSTSTQTSRIIDDEIKFMKLAEDKLQNMEKIADLTEKCTKRLSNLAKVLDEVRRNKSVAYSQISDSASDSDKNVAANIPPTPTYDLTEMRKGTQDEKLRADQPGNPEPGQPYDLNVDIQKENSEKHRKSEKVAQNKTRPDDLPFELHKDALVQNRKSDQNYTQLSTQLYVPFETRHETSDKVRQELSDKNIEPLEPYDSIHEVKPRLERISPQLSPIQAVAEKKDIFTSDSSEFIPILTDIPKPELMKSQVTTVATKDSEDYYIVKTRGKPPPALSRINLKHGQDYEVPHELSTVLEVDSPLSVKLKTHSTANTPNQTTINKETTKSDDRDSQVNPDLLHSKPRLSRRQTKTSSTDSSSNDSRLQMMDLKQFNEIMLKPFISLQEYAKKCNVTTLDDASNIDDVPREDVITDDLSSLHSDGSLPDVIAELLKRNLIREPFKFDVASNTNSTGVSSDSTLPLALSRVRKEKKKSSVAAQNKENIAETSDTLSISSNPDLENAFKKLGMGWASSTLKKTKERLALSSSSNTSSSSLSFKMKSFNNQDIPALVSDSVSSAMNLSKKPPHRKSIDNSKNAEQQTSQVNSMTVKDFLTKELAKKMTFTNKSNRDDTEEDFVSLYETRMPEEMKHSSLMAREERSVDSGGNARARTSTPVQLFKSMTYQSSSSSNLSNGLFSNADDLSSVKGTSNSMRNHSTSDKDDLTIPNYSLRMKKGLSDCSKSD